MKKNVHKRSRKKQTKKTSKKQIGTQFPLFSFLKPITKLYTARVK